MERLRKCINMCRSNLNMRRGCYRLTYSMAFCFLSLEDLCTSQPGQKLLAFGVLNRYLGCGGGTKREKSNLVNVG